MNPTRRQLLKLGAAGSAAALAGCDSVYKYAARQMGADIPESFALAADPAVSEEFHVLSRISFGPRPGDLDEIRRAGIAATIEGQLDPESIDDAPCTMLARRYESTRMSAGNVMEFRREVATEELARATAIRAVYSRRQLFEVMVEFWTDHLNIDQSKDRCAWFKTADDREVIRRHAFGRFRDLIRASALSPAMLVYLDGQDNKAGVPNENYARELLELHTMGVHGGYTQKDVMEVARCLTGWVVRKGFRKGSVEFRRALHDDGPKTVLGNAIPAGGGERDLDCVLDIVTRHPSTARFIAGKLCRRFVGDEPPAQVVDRAARAFAESDGDIKHLLRSILLSTEFRETRPARVKRPFRFVVSALRALGAETTAPEPVLKSLTRMGQAPFQFPTPDGYPDEAAPWLGTFLWRWNFALELATGRLDGATVRMGELFRRAGAETPIDLFPHFVGRLATDRERSALEGFLAAGGGRDQAVGLILASPAFQRF